MHLNGSECIQEWEFESYEIHIECMWVRYFALWQGPEGLGLCQLCLREGGAWWSHAMPVSNPWIKMIKIQNPWENQNYNMN